MIDKLKEFNKKLGIASGGRLAELSESEGVPLHTMAASVRRVSKFYGTLSTTRDVRFMRAHLLSEELAELLEAMHSRNEVEVLDAMCDLMYVLVGTAVAFDLPLMEGFDEVHRSNMSKERHADDVSGRILDKGPNYSAPNLRKVIDNVRIQNS